MLCRSWLWVYSEPPRYNLPTTAPFAITICQRNLPLAERVPVAEAAAGEGVVVAAEVVVVVAAVVVVAKHAGTSY